MMGRDTVCICTWVFGALEVFDIQVLKAEIAFIMLWLLVKQFDSNLLKLLFYAALLYIAQNNHLLPSRNACFC